MRFFQQVRIVMSNALVMFIEDMLEKGPRFQIQDVQEALEEGHPLLAEATLLRKQHGNFWIYS